MDTPLPGTLARTDGELVAVVDALLQTALVARLWVLFLDADDRMCDLILPFDDLPPDPHEHVEVPDLGRVSHGRVLASRLPELCAAVGCARLVLVWERPGDADADLAWPRALAAAIPRGAVRAQVLLSDDGARLLDDELSPVVSAA